MHTLAYPANWPMNPFHAGEVKVQQRLGTHDNVMSYAPQFVRPYMPDQHREFYSSQPFLVIAARDRHDNMWASLVFGTDDDVADATGFISSPDPTKLSIRSSLLPGDALTGSLKPGSDLGILGIEFATRRRNRVNGRLVEPSNGSGTLEFQVDQSFGNCPQYIKPRSWWVDNEVCRDDKKVEIEPTRFSFLNEYQKTVIRKAETVFVATGYRGKGEDPRFGNDASHRGGSSGFLHVEGSNTLLLPDYSGNGHFNTIGNLELDPRMGLTIPIFETGGMLQLSGTAVVRWDADDARKRFPGALRIIEYTITEVVELPPGSLPLRWSELNKNQLQVQVAEKVRESQDVVSFYLGPVSGDAPLLPPFKPGQHLPITVKVGQNTSVERTYSLSFNSTRAGEFYRISVKRDPLGLVSRYLHDNVEIGDVLSVQKPAGDFVYDDSSSRTLVLLSSGIGVTPLLPMLYKFVENLPNSSISAHWIYTTTDGKHHPLRREVERLVALSHGRVKVHIVYTKPLADDSDFDTSGRVSAALITGLVPDLADSDIYMCGSPSFVNGVRADLEAHGVQPSRIRMEDF